MKDSGHGLRGETSDPAQLARKNAGSATHRRRRSPGEFRGRALSLFPRIFGSRNGSGGDKTPENSFPPVGKNAPSMSVSTSKSPQSRKSVVIADDHELYLDGLATLLVRLGYEIAASVGDGLEALKAIRELRPGYAILDGSMPNLNGVAVIESLRAENFVPLPRFLILTMFTHGHLAADARAAGAGGIVSKEDTARELEMALESLTDPDGGFFLSRAFREDAEAYLSGELSTLTPRERQILNAIVRGATTKEIADLLGLSARTVDHHRERLMRKIGAKNTADVVRFAARTGMRMV
ncbi:MAG: response regulator transcription factor [Akkermansiaceae bacterium]|nr:response regulator transcription factor [Akkermansiaceae bacterium]MCP5551642.1 response regulator transcription factor [Akkermansiaceae bacterium]